MSLLKKKCKTPGCPNLHKNVSGYCDECMRKYRKNHPHSVEYERTRPSSTERGYNYKWTVFARQFLKDNPVCAICGKPAQVVDHKDIPADVMMELYGSFDLDPSHYQSLCVSCNTKKGMREDKEFREQYKQDKEWLANYGDSAKPQGGGQKNS